MDSPARPMKHDLSLKIASLVSVFLFALHVAQDVVRGYEPGNLSNYTAIFIFAAWVHATLVLVGRRSGYVVVLLVSILSLGVPYLHMSGKGLGPIADSDGALLFTLVLLALGTTSLFSALLCVHGLWHGRRQRAELPA